MGWEKTMFALFDDLEQQAEGLHLAGRDADVAELTMSEYSRVSLGARLHASLGLELRARLVGGHVVVGRLARLGEYWLLLVAGSAEWIVRYEGIASLAGLSARAHSEQTWSVMDRLSLRAVLRRLSGENEPCLVHLVDAQQIGGRIGRVGRDFFELRAGEGAQTQVQVVPVAPVVAIQGRAS